MMVRHKCITKVIFFPYEKLIKIESQWLKNKQIVHFGTSFGNGQLLSGKILANQNKNNFGNTLSSELCNYSENIFSCYKAIDVPFFATVVIFPYLCIYTLCIATNHEIAYIRSSSGCDYLNAKEAVPNRFFKISHSG